ncbi:hypothetical protein NDU88_007480 [Pleurodeles waltl]|uniref:Uncharacterized protein n=1 Tax=Pleurodeles waltl TaxID=8319 RepID=A0AAV7RQ87_PLEWA|nr:hypothetical protein NDU88_007480 [Pleurodeles waltl]
MSRAGKWEASQYGKENDNLFSTLHDERYRLEQLFGHPHMACVVSGVFEAVLAMHSRAYLSRCCSNEGTHITVASIKISVVIHSVTVDQHAPLCPGTPGMKRIQLLIKDKDWNWARDRSEIRDPEACQA